MTFNAFGFAEVDFEAHYTLYAKPFLIEGNEENNRFFVQEAQESHVFGVNQALHELIRDALLLLPTVPFSEVAEHHFRFGVMRRLRMIDSAFRCFQSIVRPQRVDALTQEQSDRICRDLNALYIDVLGLLDNYAWTLVFQFGEAKTQAINPIQVGLFKDSFRRDANLKAVADLLDEFRDWERDVKARRNPAAHRIPLYVPSAALSENDVTEYRRLAGTLTEANRKGDFESASSISAKTWQLGTFRSQFLHDPAEPIMDIFPTIPADIGAAVKIGRLAHNQIRATARSASS